MITNTKEGQVVVEPVVENVVVAPVTATEVLPVVETGVTVSEVVVEPVPVTAVVAVAPAQNSNSVKRGVGRPKTKVTLKRVVLLNGQIVGRGRPSAEGKKDRTVLYIPMEETYDAAKHGLGVKYTAAKQFKASVKRVDLKSFKKMVTQTV